MSSDLIRRSQDVLKQANKLIPTIPRENRRQAGQLEDAIRKRIGDLTKVPAEELRATREEISGMVDRLSALLGVANPSETNVKPPSLAIDIDTSGVRQIGENVLSDYINVQYHINLSMVHFETAAKIQTSMISSGESTPINLNDMTVDQRKDKSVTIASTGEVFRNRQVATLFSESPVPTQSGGAATSGEGESTGRAPDTDSSGGTTLAPVSMTQQEWINAIRPAAEIEAARRGVTPEEIIAQAGLETGWGKASIGNNIFGVKADSSWTGETVEADTWENINGQRVKVRAKFRKYNSVEDSIRDQGRFLENNNIYRNAGYFTATTPEERFAALKRAGYATDPQYVSKLTSSLDTVRKTLGTAASIGGGIAGGAGGAGIPPGLSGMNPTAPLPPVPDRGSTTLEETRYLADPRNYYNIAELLLENTMAPSANNPLISSLLTMKMRIAEPMGFKFVEDIKRLAHDQGYRFVNHTRAVYRVDIWFSGYKMYEDSDPNVPVGTWVENIPVYNIYDSKKSVTPISYYVTMTKVDAELTANGTMYEVDFTVIGGMGGLRPEDNVIDGSTLKTHKGALTTKGTMGQFLDSLEYVLPLLRKDNSDQKILREYKFYAPEWLRAAEIGGSGNDRLNTLVGALEGSNPSAAPVVTSSRGTTILELLKAAFGDAPKVRDYFLVDGDDNKNFLVPRMHLSVRFNVKYYDGSGVQVAPKVGMVDKELNDYKKITIEYLIEPYISYKGFTSDKFDKVKEAARPENQLQRVKNLIKYGMLTRIYNYIWTGLNTEILDLQLKFKAFYYTPLWKNAESGSPTRGRGGRSVADNPYKDTQSLLGDDGVNSILKQLFGTKNRIQEASAAYDSINPWSVYNQGSMNTSPDVDPSLSQTSASEDLMKYLYYENDHFENDLLYLEGMHIKGDPIWLLSTYATARINPLKEEKGISKTGSGSVMIRPHSERVIFLRMNVPDQDAYMNGQFFSEGLNKHPHIIGGFYTIYKVESSFIGGKFTQKLTGPKITNLNFVEELFTMGPGRVYMKAADPSVLGEEGTGRPTPERTEGGPSDQTGQGGANVRRPLTEEQVSQVDKYLAGDPSVKTSDLSYEQKVVAAREFYMSKGLSEAQANAVVGNLIGESAMNTGAIGDSGISLGLMQWNKERRYGGSGYEGLVPFAQRTGGNVYDLKTQLEYSWQEREGPERSNWNAALNASDQREMTQVFMRRVERPLHQGFSQERDNGARLAQTLGGQAQSLRGGRRTP